METQNQNYKSARQLYIELIKELKLPENPQDSDKYDWNLWREFVNCLKQNYSNPDYILCQSEWDYLNEIECCIILKSIGVEPDPNIERDTVIKVLEQRIDIRDSVLLPDNYTQIDGRIPLDIVPCDDAERIYKEINPDGCKSWSVPFLLPVNNYADYKQIPSGTESADDEGIKAVSEQISEGVADGELLRNDHLPYEEFGGLAKSVIIEYAQAYKVNPDLITAIVLLIVGGAANRKTILKTWNYINRPSLWMAIVERSGGNKTEPMNRLMKPLFDVNDELVNQYNKAYNDFVKSGSKGTPPVRMKFVVNDTTPEILYRLMKANGLVVVRDELNGFFKDIGRYSSSGEVENYISSWSFQPLSVDRVNAASFEVKNPFLSIIIIGGIQPKVMAEAFGAKGFEESGFLARWLFLMSTDSKVPDSVSEKLISRDVENKWYNLILSLWRMKNREFRLSVEAGKAYQGYMLKTASIMNAPECEDTIRAMYAKMRIYCLRFALIIHLLKYGDKASDEIKQKTIDLAVQTCNVFAYWNRQAMSFINGTEAKKTISNKELLNLLVERYNVQNQSELARLIGRSQQYVSKILSNKSSIKKI